MSETWEEYIERYRSNPEERATAEAYLEDLGDAQPVKSAYWQAILRGDQDAARIIIIYRDIFRLRKKAKHDPNAARLLAGRIQEVKELEAAAKAAG